MGHFLDHSHLNRLRSLPAEIRLRHPSTPLPSGFQSSASSTSLVLVSLAQLPTPCTFRHSLRSLLPPWMLLLRLPTSHPAQVLLLHVQGLLRRDPGSSGPHTACSLPGGLPGPPDICICVCPTQTSPPSTHQIADHCLSPALGCVKDTGNQYIQTSHHSLYPLLLIGSPSQRSLSNKGTGPTPAWDQLCSSLPSPMSKLPQIL